MEAMLDYVGRYWYSGLLVVGVVLAIWFVGSHRSKLMNDESKPPQE